MARKVFICYRRDDSAGYAGRVHDRLEREFGRDLLFMDVDSIPLGTNFVKVLGEEVAKCDVLLALIGKSWLDARDENGNRRLENPDDFVRIEIATALKRDIPVIPILLEGTRVPKADKLPDELKELALRNGLDVRHASFPNDMERLIRELKQHIPGLKDTQSAEDDIAMKTIRLSVAKRQIPAAWRIRCEVDHFIIYDREGNPTSYGATEAEARNRAREKARILRAPEEDLNGEAYRIVPD